MARCGTIYKQMAKPENPNKIINPESPIRIQNQNPESPVIGGYSPIRSAESGCGECTVSLQEDRWLWRREKWGLGEKSKRALEKKDRTLEKSKRTLEKR